MRIPYYVPTENIYSLYERIKDKMYVPNTYILERIPEFRELQERGARLYLYMLEIDIDKWLKILAIDDQVSNYSGGGMRHKRMLDEIIEHYNSTTHIIGTIPDKVYGLILQCLWWGTPIPRFDIDDFYPLPLFQMALISYPKKSIAEKILYIYGDKNYYILLEPEEETTDKLRMLGQKGIVIWYGEYKVDYPDFHDTYKSALNRYEKEFPYVWLRYGQQETR